VVKDTVREFQEYLDNDNRPDDDSGKALK